MLSKVFGTLNPASEVTLSRCIPGAQGLDSKTEQNLALLAGFVLSEIPQIHFIRVPYVEDLSRDPSLENYP